MSETDTYERTEVERYTLQLIRLNQIGVYLLLVLMAITIDIPINAQNAIVLAGIGIILLNSLAFFYSATGVNPAVWIREKTAEVRQWVR